MGYFAQTEKNRVGSRGSRHGIGARLGRRRSPWPRPAMHGSPMAGRGMANRLQIIYDSQEALSLPP
jgi:hypothetical protein